MTDQEKRMLIRGMSIANGLLMNAGCTHRSIISTHQKAVAEAREIDEGDAAHREEFMQIADEIGDTIAAKFPNGLLRATNRTPKGN